MPSVLQRIGPETEACLQELKKKVVVGLVGGSDLVKISEQMSMGDQDGKTYRKIGCYCITLTTGCKF